MFCGGCGKKRDRDGGYCSLCLDKRRRKKEEHVARGGCTYMGCSSPRDGGTRTCKFHREYYRQRNAAKYAREKKQRRDRKLATMSFAKLLQDFDAVL